MTQIRVLLYAQARSKRRVRKWLLSSWHLRGLSKVLPEQPDAVVYSSPGLIGGLGAEQLARRRARLAFEVRGIGPSTLCKIRGYSPRHPFLRFTHWIERKEVTSCVS